MKYMHLQLMTSRLITIIKVRLRLKYGWVNDLKPFPFFLFSPRKFSMQTAGNMFYVDWKTLHKKMVK